MQGASAAFAGPIQVMVVNDRDVVQHRGTLQLPRRAPAAPGRPPSSPDLTRLRPLMSALGDALASQEEGLDPERLSRTYAALMSELQKLAGLGVHKVELTPDTLGPVGEEEEEVVLRCNNPLCNAEFKWSRPVNGRPIRPELCLVLSDAYGRGNGVIHRGIYQLQGDDNSHVGRPCEVSLAPPCPELFCELLGDLVTGIAL